MAKTRRKRIPTDMFSPSTPVAKQVAKKKPRNSPKKKSDPIRKQATKGVLVDKSRQGAYWEIDRIVGKRSTGEGEWEYQIRWKGCSPSKDTWEPEENLSDTALNDALLFGSMTTTEKDKKAETKKKEEAKKEEPEKEETEKEETSSPRRPPKSASKSVRPKNSRRSS
mmetsp:Transcript_41117/g.57835  ORF Transcript_41117/g.57835 Transcript_41117/m.57835 type:complete len:167 (+) Transcript_41117:53-553(+)